MIVLTSMVSCNEKKVSYWVSKWCIGECWFTTVSVHQCWAGIMITGSGQLSCMNIGS